MSYISAYLPEIVLVILVSALIGAWLHEGSHYLVGWMGGSDPQMRYEWFPFFPNGVLHGNIDKIDGVIIRLSGFAPLTYIPALFVAAGLLLANKDLISWMVFGSFFVAVFISTRSDRTATRNPEQFREKEEEDCSRMPLIILLYDDLVGVGTGWITEEDK